MSTVVEATDLTLGRTVAIKFVRSSANGVSEERLRREAVACAQFQSEHIVRVFEAGVVESGGLFIAMERLRGFDVQTQIRESGRIPTEEAVSYVLQVCEALAHAHAARIVHRDIKPSNMFVVTGTNGRRTIKLLDFGIALNRGIRKHSSLTRDTLLGTPQFMSPEQIREPKAVDSRADIWAVGVSLFQMLSGQLPFQSPRLGELIMSICESDAPTLASMGVRVPAGIEICIRRCLQKNPVDRYATVKELAADLLLFGPTDTGRILFEGISNILVGLDATLDAPRDYEDDEALSDPTTERVSHNPDSSGLYDERAEDTHTTQQDEMNSDVQSALPTLAIADDDSDEDDDDVDEPTSPTQRGRGKSSLRPPSSVPTRPSQMPALHRSYIARPRDSISPSASPPPLDALVTGGPVVSSSGVTSSKGVSVVHVAAVAIALTLGSALLFGALQSRRSSATAPEPAAVPAGGVSMVPEHPSPPVVVAAPPPTTPSAVAQSAPLVTDTAAPRLVVPPTIQSQATQAQPIPSVRPSAARPLSPPPAPASAAPKSPSGPSVVPLPPELQGRQ